MQSPVSSNFCITERYAFIAVGLICAALSAVVPCYCADRPKATAKSPAAHVTLTGEINQLVTVCGAAGLALSKPSVPSTITKVRLGTMAAYSGIKAGDNILDAKIDQNILSLVLQRGDQKFQARIPVDSKALTSMIPKTAAVVPQPTLVARTSSGAASVGGNSTPLSREISEKEAENILSAYTFIVVVDHSGSMSAPADPNDAAKTSKMDWLKKNVVDFAAFLQQHFKSGTTVIPFNSSYEVHEVSSPAAVAREIQELSPSGGTDLGRPVRAAIQLAAARPNPQMILVFSDGMENIGTSLSQEVIAATNMLPPGQVVISFVQIGSEQAGMNVIKDLDEKLVSRGANYDMVDARYFVDLQHYGLKRILADAVIRAKNTASTAQKSP